MKKLKKKQSEEEERKPKANIDDKMDFFYNPYRKDFVKEHEQCMSFEEAEECHKLDWGSLSKLIFSDRQKPFSKALEKLNKNKCKRFVKKFQDGQNIHFLGGLIKASRRRVQQKSTKHKDSKCFSGPRKSNERGSNGEFINQVLNLNTRKFQIPDRRGTISQSGFKRLSSVQDTILSSETDMKAEKCENSFRPASEIVLEEEVKGSEKKIEIDSSSKTESSSSTSSEESKSSISCKFVINVQKQNSEKSKRLSDDEKSDGESGMILQQ